MLRFISVSDILNCRDIPWNVLTNNHKDLKGHNYYVPFFYYVYDVFYFYNIMMSGLSPDDYNIKKRRREEIALCVFLLWEDVI